jgi:hypothetical protein
MTVYLRFTKGDIMFQIISNAINDDIHSEFYAAIRNGPTVSYSRIRNIVSFDGVNTRKNDKKNLVWFREMERKFAKLSMTTFAYRSSF